MQLKVIIFTGVKCSGAVKCLIGYLAALAFVVLIACPFEMEAQSTTVSGVVVEASSREPVMNATLLAYPGDVSALTDAEGRFLLTSSGPIQRIIVQAFGFASDTLSELKDRMVIPLNAYELQTVEIRAPYVGPKAIPGRIAPSLQQLRDIPTLLGEPDPIRALINLPGISGGVEGSTGLHVRGSPPDQTLVLLDGGTIYNSGHFFGFLSVFHSAAVGSLELYRGYIPAKYSGRLSSVLSVNTKSGRADSSHTELSFGLLNTSVLQEGPIGNSGKWSYLLGGRIAHSGSLTAFSSLFGGEEAVNILAGMLDGNAKATYKGDDGSQFSISLYAGEDLYRSTGDDGGIKGIYQLNWGNKVVSTNYTRPIGQRFISRSNFVHNRYDNQFSITAISDGVRNSLRTSSSNKEWSIHQSLLYSLPLGEITLGTQFLRRSLQPVNAAVDDTQGPMVPGSEQLFFNDRFASYLSTEFHFGDIHLFTGASLNTLKNKQDGTTYTNLEPRVAVTYQFDNKTTIELGYSKTVQDLHFATALGGELPYDVWLPVTRNLPPPTAQQLSLGIASSLPGKYLNWNADLFAKRMNRLATTSLGVLRLFGDSSEGWEGQLVGDGLGLVYGLELGATYQQPSSRFSIGYTFSRSFREFPGINNGSVFAYRFDRPHDLEMSSLIRLSDKWDLASTFILQSGARFTAPINYIIDVTGVPQPVYNQRNNAQLPTYHRLDIMFSKRITIRKNKREARLDLGFYNAYARSNTSVAIARQGFTREPFGDAYTAQHTFLLRGAVFTIIPTVNYSVKW